jgi:hypothetical protein
MPLERDFPVVQSVLFKQRSMRDQATLFPAVLDDLVPADHMCRVIDAFVERLVMCVSERNCSLHNS